MNKRNRNIKTQNRDVLFIHGMWCHGNVADRLKSVLENQGWRFHSPTLPEHHENFSEETLKSYSVRHYVDAIHDYISQSDLVDGSYSVIGHSMGGLIAQVIASEREVESLVLLNSVGPAGINHINVNAIRSAIHIFKSFDFWNRVNRPPYSVARFGLLNEVDEPLAREYHDGLHHDSGRSFFDIAFWWLNPNSIRIQPKEVSGRKLILSGGRDRIVSPRVAQQISSLYPEAEFRLFPNNGHWFFGEKNDLLIFQGISEWLLEKSTSHHQPTIHSTSADVSAESEATTSQLR